MSKNIIDFFRQKTLLFAQILADLEIKLNSLKMRSIKKFVHKAPFRFHLFKRTTCLTWGSNVKGTHNFEQLTQQSPLGAAPVLLRKKWQQLRPKNTFLSHTYLLTQQPMCGSHKQNRNGHLFFKATYNLITDLLMCSLSGCSFQSLLVFFLTYTCGKNK